MDVLMAHWPTLRSGTKLSAHVLSSSFHLTAAEVPEGSRLGRAQEQRLLLWGTTGMKRPSLPGPPRCCRTEKPESEPSAVASSLQRSAHKGRGPKETRLRAACGLPGTPPHWQWQRITKTKQKKKQTVRK